jgi:hypothetical protein
MKNTARAIAIAIIMISILPLCLFGQELGDANDNGTIDIVDALVIAQYNVGLDPAGFYPNVSDVNADGSVSIVDALLVAQYYVGLIHSFPAGTPQPSAAPTQANLAWDFSTTAESCCCIKRMLTTNSSIAEHSILKLHEQSSRPSA